MPTRLKRLLEAKDTEQTQLEKLTESILPNLDSDIRRQVQAMPADDAAVAEEKWRRAVTEAVPSVQTQGGVTAKAAGAIGTPGKLSKFLAPTILGDSIATEIADLITVDGAVQANINFRIRGFAALSGEPTKDNWFVGAPPINLIPGYLTGTDNQGIGGAALENLSTGSNNVALGMEALWSTSEGSDNVGIGYRAGRLCAGSNNIAIGSGATLANTVGSNQLVIGGLVYGTSINSLSGGRIGIGVTAPSCTLDVGGAVRGLYQRFGSGSPEGVVSAPVGARYSRTDGGAGTSLYVKEDGGTGPTGWVAMKTYSGGVGTNIYTADGTLASNRTVSGGGTYSLSFASITNLALNALTNSTLQAGAAATVQAGTGALTLGSTSGPVDVLATAGNVTVSSAAAGGQVTVSAKGQLRIKTPNVNAGTAVAAQVLTLSDATTGAVDFTTLPGVVNIYTADGTLTSNRTVTGAGKSLSITGLAGLTLGSTSTVGITGSTGVTLSGSSVLSSASVVVQATAPTVRFVTGGSLDLYLASTTSSGAATDYLLGVNPSTGQIRYTTTTAAALNLDKVAVVNTVADLKNVNPTAFLTAMTLGYWAAYDGGGSVYRWDAGTTGTNDGSKILSSVSGSWLNTAAVVNVKQWGAQSGVYGSAAAKINAAIAYAGTFTNPPTVLIPPGEYLLETSVAVRANNIHVDLFGKLKNNNGIATPVLVVSESPTYSATTSAGVVTNYNVKNVVIDGHGVGVLDQNSQNVPDWTYSSSHPNAGYHTVWAYGVDGFCLKGATIKNGVVWSVSIECCKNFEVSGCKVYTGFANGRMINGHYHFLSAQDGIHAHDSKDGFIHHNIVESGDDSFAVTAQRTVDAGNVVVSDNRGQVKVLAYNPDGSINHYSPSGRFGLSCFNTAASTSVYCCVQDVTFANNVIQGGQGLFCVYDEGTFHNNLVPTNIRFIGNTFADQTSPGDVDGSGNSLTMDDSGVIRPQLDFAWIVDGAQNVEFLGNTFNNIARVGHVGGVSGKNGTVVFRGNKFSNLKKGHPYTLYPAETRAVLWFTEGTKLIVDGNTFENNDIVPLLVGYYADLTFDKYEEVVFNNNVCFNNNLKWLSTTPVSTEYSAVLNVNGAKYVEFNGNKITNNYGYAVCARSIRTLVAKNNKIKGVGNGSFTANGDVFFVASQPNYSSTYTDIQSNNVEDVDGQFLYTVNPGQLFVQDNVINNPCRSLVYDSANSGFARGYLMTISVNGSTLSTDPYANFGGFLSGNTSYRSSAQSPFFIYSPIDTTAYTGKKFTYTLANNDFGPNYTAPEISLYAGNLVSSRNTGTTNKLAKFTSPTNLGDSIVTESTGLISVGGAVSVSDSYKIANDYIVSWNTAYKNSVFGTRPTGWTSITGLDNTGVGYQAATALTSGSRNTAVGTNSLVTNTGGSDNTAVGQYALQLANNASFNTAIGAQASRNSTSASYNTSLGYRALADNTTGGQNVAGGAAALMGCTTGDNNTAIGYFSMFSATTSAGNTAVGSNTLTGLTSGASNNVAVGMYSGSLQTSGSRNVAIGYHAQVPLATGSNQLSIGNLIYGTNVDGTAADISTGNIGIGTKAPACRLDVAGAIKGTYIRFGAVDPEGNESAPVGAMYSRSTGGSGTTLYVKESGSSTTGWVAMKTYSGGVGTNIYNSDGILSGNRTVNGGGYSLTFATATVAGKHLNLGTSTNDGTTSDYILGINPTDGRIRYTTTTVASLSKSTVVFNWNQPNYESSTSQFSVDGTTLSYLVAFNDLSSLIGFTSSHNTALLAAYNANKKITFTATYEHYVGGGYTLKSELLVGNPTGARMGSVTNSNGGGVTVTNVTTGKWTIQKTTGGFNVLEMSYCVSGQAAGDPHGYTFGTGTANGDITDFTPKLGLTGSTNSNGDLVFLYCLTYSVE